MLSAGVTVSVIPSKSPALNTEVITYTVTVSGNATGATTFTIGGVTPSLSATGTNCTASAGTINVPAAGVVSGVFTFSVTCSGAAVTPTLV